MQTQAPQQHPGANDGEIVIDLAKYVRAIVQGWRTILAFGVIGALLGGLYTLVFPPPYEAVSTVALIRIRTDVRFDERLKTTQEGLSATGDARRAALLALALSGDIATAVTAKLEARLSAEDRDPATLARKVTADAGTGNRADVINIRVRDRDARLAADIANTWAAEYEKEVNAIYGNAPLDVKTDVEREYARVEKELDLAQAALEKFTRENTFVELERLLEVRNRVRVALGEAQTMRQQVSAAGNGAAATNAFSLLLLKSASYGVTLPGLRMDTFPVVSADDQRADIDSLVKTLNERLTAIDNDLSMLSRAGTGPMDVRVAEASVEAQKAVQAKLKQTRDISRSTFATLANKRAELSVGAAVAGQEVRRVGEALVPTATVQGRTITAILGALAGLGIGLIIVLLMHLVRK